MFSETYTIFPKGYFKGLFNGSGKRSIRGASSTPPPRDEMKQTNSARGTYARETYTRSWKCVIKISSDQHAARKS
jgi:hypothetical protein